MMQIVGTGFNYSIYLICFIWVMVEITVSKTGY